MMRSLAVVVFAVWLIGCSAGAWAQQNLILKTNPVSQNDVITLSDLFDLDGQAGEVAVARAPAPGERVALDPGFVREIASEAGFNWANASGLLRVYVTRASRTIADADIQSLIAETLFMDTGKVHDVALSGSRQTLAAPTDALGGPVLISLDHDTRTGLFRAEISAWPDGPPKRIGGRAVGVVDVPVLTRPIQRGDLVSANDIEWSRIPGNEIRPGTLMTAETVIGMAARRALRPAVALRETDFEAPLMIERGQITVLTYRAGALVLTAQARALQNAAEGERARFVNLQSNRTVEAIAIAPGRASVTRPGFTH